MEVCPRTVRKSVVARRFCRLLKLAVLVAGLCVSGVAFAERLPLNFYTTAEGLPNNNINRVVRDSRGFLWFCTADGLSRFDGYTFTNFGTDQGLPHSNVTDLLEARDGHYWVATSGGLARFDPESGRGERAAAPHEDLPSSTSRMFTSIASSDEDPRARSITVLLQDRSGTIWVGTEKGLCRVIAAGGRSVVSPVDIGMPKDYPEQGEITSILENDDSSLWIGSFSGLYRRFKDGRSARFASREGLPDDIVGTLLRDHLGRLWAGTRAAGFFQFAPGDSRRPIIILRNYKLKALVPRSWVFQLMETSGHRFWIATNAGLIEFFPDAGSSGHKFQLYTTRQGLSYREIDALSEDPSGNLWLGTSTAGAMKLARNGFVSYGEEDGVATVNSIFEDRTGKLCVKGAVTAGNHVPGSAEHIDFACFDGQRFHGIKLAALAVSPGWVFERVVLQAHDREWWLGTGAGVLRFAATNSFAGLASAQPIAKYASVGGVPYAQVFRIFEDSRSDVWVSTISSLGNGFARWERATERWMNLASMSGVRSLQDDLARAFAEDAEGNVWSGFNGRLFRYGTKDCAWFGLKDGVPAGKIMDIFADHSGRLWVASAAGGLVRIDNAGSPHPSFSTYTMAKGLSSNRAEVITEDLYGHIYVGTGRGLDRLDPLTGRIQHFTAADGLARGTFRATFRDRKGTLWFGMAGGISRLEPAAEKPATAPPILLTALAAAGNRREVFPFGERNVLLPDLTHDQNRLDIEFVGLDFTPGETLRYQYKLQGNDWSAPSEQRSISFARLAPGRYTFLVRALGSGGAASAVPASVIFRVLPPVWQRWWFLMALAIGITGGIWALYRYRVAQLLQIANVRAGIALDLHDDIGSNLTKIAILSEVARQQLGVQDEPLGEDSLMAIARISRESVASMSDIVWAINPQHDRLLDLVRRMRQHAEQVFTARGVRLIFRAPGEKQDIKLRTDIRRDVFLIFKEAVNNAARHARCTEVEVDFRVEGDALSLEVRDNGTGFDPQVSSNGEGLANMRRRAERLGGVCEVRTAPDKHTVVQVAIDTRNAPTSIGR